MNSCLGCGATIKDGEHICMSCNIKYGQTHVIVSQAEYQKLRYKEMLYDTQGDTQGCCDDQGGIAGNMLQ